MWRMVQTDGMHGVIAPEATAAIYPFHHMPIVDWRSHEGPPPGELVVDGLGVFVRGGVVVTPATTSIARSGFAGPRSAAEGRRGESIVEAGIVLAEERLLP